jgi:serine beta-lactamase-like protein LACTB, mitochondrial
LAKRWNRAETWIGLLVLGIGGVILAVAGLWIYVSATATPIHPNPQDVPSQAGAVPSHQWTDAVERGRQIMRAGLSEQNLPGVSVAVGVDGEIVWTEGFGFADIDRKTPVTSRTRFRIGTASIPLTSAAAGLLLERNQLSVDEKIQTYVPEYPATKWPVTVRQVMAHTAGIGSDGGDEGPLFGQHCDRPVDALPFFAERELRFEPGTQYSYSRFGWIAISAAIEKITGQPLLTFMQKQIFEPLRMDDTMPDLSTEADPDRSTSYFPRFAADPKYGPDVMRELDLSCYSGSSVFLSTASDMVRFVLAINNGELLQPATVKLLQTSETLTSGAETGYGLGWDLDTLTTKGGQPVAVVGHDGDLLGGIVSSVITVPSYGNVVVAVISNTSYADTPALALQVAEAFTSPKK